MKSAVLIFVGALAVGVSAIMAWRGTCPCHVAALDTTATLDDPLPMLGTLPEFRLTNEAGQEFGSRELAGKIWVATFIFTRCPGTCPQQTVRMSELQRQLSSRPGWHDIRLVSFSVDPEYDTPAVLRAYARRASAEPDHWHFLTGPRQTIWHLSKDGFKLDVGEAPPDAASPLFHSPNFVVVDQQARIRGYYDGLSEEGVERISKAVQRLLNESPSGDKRRRPEEGALTVFEGHTGRGPMLRPVHRPETGSLTVFDGLLLFIRLPQRRWFNKVSGTVVEKGVRHRCAKHPAGRSGNGA